MTPNLVRRARRSVPAKKTPSCGPNLYSAASHLVSAPRTSLLPHLCVRPDVDSFLRFLEQEAVRMH